MKQQKTVTFQIPQSLKNRLEKDAEDKMTSQASLVRRALDNHLSEGEIQ